MIPAKKLAAAADKSGLLDRRARLAETLKKLNRKKGHAFRSGTAAKAFGEPDADD